MQIEEAIEIMNNFIKDTPKLPYECLMNKEIEAVETLLNELEKKDRVIDLMAEYIVDLIKYNNSEENRDKEDIKQYFSEKVGTTND